MSWLDNAACATSGLDPTTWDADIAGETPRQRQTRHRAARTICHGCPVADTCVNQLAGGVRAGYEFPDEIPGWTLTESNSWFGLSAQGALLHGDMNGYRRHYRNGEKPCRSCLAAARRDNKDAYRAA